MSGACLQYGIMLFFAAWCLIMTLYIILCLPETKGVPIEEIVVVWRKHWLWKRFVEPAASEQNGGGQPPSCVGSVNTLCIRTVIYRQAGGQAAQQLPYLDGCPNSEDKFITAIWPYGQPKQRY